jgi:hypothetical protein
MKNPLFCQPKFGQQQASLDGGIRPHTGTRSAQKKGGRHRLSPVPTPGLWQQPVSLITLPARQGPHGGLPGGGKSFSDTEVSFSSRPAIRIFSHLLDRMSSGYWYPRQIRSDAKSFPILIESIVTLHEKSVRPAPPSVAPAPGADSLPEVHLPAAGPEPARISADLLVGSILVRDKGEVYPQIGSQLALAKSCGCPNDQTSDCLADPRADRRVCLRSRQSSFA